MHTQPIVLPIGQIKLSTYENVIVDCPCCGRENIFNRATDLGNFTAIGGCDVSCLLPECKKFFRLLGDLVNPAFEMMLWDCDYLIRCKQYTNAVLTSCLAHEVLFNLFLTVGMVYKPYALDLNRDLEDLKQLYNLLKKCLNDLAFGGLRMNVVVYIAEGRSPTSIPEAKKAISNLKTNVPQRYIALDLANLPNPKIRELLENLMASKINDLRNRIVHKEAHRPTYVEARKVVDEAQNVLFPLGGLLGERLGLHDDVNWYVMHLSPDRLEL